MLSSDIKLTLPTGEELPYTDNQPVDNEDQNLLPNVLLFLLTSLWADRFDWFFGAGMGIYHTTGMNPRVPIVPDAFLSLGVERKKGGKSRRSYVTWEENDIVPILTLEMVSHTPGGEYDEKLKIYAQLGVLYYVIYNPEFAARDRHAPFEIYKLIEGDYELQQGEPFWMPEIGLGIGRAELLFGNVMQEQLTWFDERGDRHLSAAEAQEQRADLQQQWAETQRQRAETERQRTDQLAQRLRELGEEV